MSFELPISKESTLSQPQESSGTISNGLNIQELLPSLPSRRIDRRRLLDDDERDLDNIPIDPIYSQSTKTVPKPSVDEDDTEEYVPVKKRKNLQVAYTGLQPHFFRINIVYSYVIEVADPESEKNFLRLRNIY